jgi:hypothetical protein
MSALQLADNDIVKDAYAGFKALIVRKFGATNTPLEPINKYASDPDGYHVLAQRALTAAGTRLRLCLLVARSFERKPQLPAPEGR